MKPIDELSLVGGNVALDFVNTAEGRGHPDAGDALRTPRELAIWGKRSGLLASAAVTPVDRAELRRAVAVRELLYRVLRARVEGRRASPGDLDALAASAAAAYRAGRLEAVTGAQVAWRWDRAELATVRHVAVTSALELLARPDGRLKQCPGSHCGWFFLDTTKRGNRRWCSMSEARSGSQVRPSARTVGGSQLAPKES